MKQRFQSQPLTGTQMGKCFAVIFVTAAIMAFFFVQWLKQI